MLGLVIGYVQQPIGMLQVTWGGCSSRPAVVDAAFLLLLYWGPEGDFVPGWGRPEGI